MSCDHRWKATHANQGDYGYHCEACGLDPADPGKAYREAKLYHAACIMRLTDYGTRFVSLFLAPVVLGYCVAGVWGAVIAVWSRFVLEFMRMR